MTLTREKLDELEALAKKASPGPWGFFCVVERAYEVCRTDNYALGQICMPNSRIDAEFIAAVYPEQFLALIALARKGLEHD